jgi:hypothetical protein
MKSSATSQTLPASRTALEMDLNVFNAKNRKPESTAGHQLSWDYRHHPACTWKTFMEKMCRYNLRILAKAKANHNQTEAN